MKIKSEEFVDEEKTADIDLRQFGVFPALAKKNPFILVTDDDPLFRARLGKIAERKGIHLYACSSLRELNTSAVPKLFDIAIVDYYLDDFKTNLKGTDIATLLEGTPVILTSVSNHCVED